MLDNQNIPEQVIDKNMAASMSLDYIVRGLTIAIETSIKKGNFNGENLL